LSVEVVRLAQLRTLATLALAASSAAATPSMNTMSWEEIPVAMGVDKHNVIASPLVQLKNETDNLKFLNRYEVILRSGERAKYGNSYPFGLALDINGMPVYKYDSETGAASETLEISNAPDFTSLLTAGDSIFMITHFEAPIPSSMYITKLVQDPVDGELSAEWTEAIDWSFYGGIWVPCAGSVTPWGTHLGSEEYEPAARLMMDYDTVEEMVEKNSWKGYQLTAHMRYYGYYLDAIDMEMIRTMIKPYMYGFPTEVAVAEDGSYTAVKHMSMGRLAIELPYVMPDQKTAFITDDGTNVLFAMYKADTPGDLTQGTLYGAKFIQLSEVGTDGGEFTIEWIELGWASDAELLAVAPTTGFYDIFEAEELQYEADPEVPPTCPDGFTMINTTPGLECLKVKEGMEKLAAFFETRRYAAMLGCTTEGSKWEGITFSPGRMQLYTAMSEVRYGMEDYARKGKESNQYDVGTENDMKLAYNWCGCVYALDVNEEMTPINMKALTCGTPITENADPKNKCDLEGIANPDNVAFIEEYDTLIIGEDTGSGHQNDVIWSYDMKSDEMTRIFSTPYGAETTSPWWYNDIMGTHIHMHLRSGHV